MYLYHNPSTDPAYNLALEEYALAGLELDMILLWRNRPAVIIGKNQNALEEVDLDFVRSLDIPVIRRQSGGGAVFHDLGNINFTVIHKMAGDDFSNYQRFTAPIRDFLEELGVRATLSGRNDLTIDGMKFSGNAQAAKNGRIMHHGTILYSADFSALAGALKPRDIKVESKGIKSVRARVTNVAPHLRDPMPVEEFLDRLYRYFERHVEGIREYRFTERDRQAVERLVTEKYGTWQWNIGGSPPYNCERVRRWDFGIVELRLAVRDGVMEGVHLSGDFFGLADKKELEERLTGVRHQREAVAAALEGVDLSRYIHGMTGEQFLELL